MLISDSHMLILKNENRKIVVVLLREDPAELDGNGNPPGCNLLSAIREFAPYSYPHEFLNKIVFVAKIGKNCCFKICLILLI